MCVQLQDIQMASFTNKVVFFFKSCSVDTLSYSVHITVVQCLLKHKFE